MHQIVIEMYMEGLCILIRVALEKKIYLHFFSWFLFIMQHFLIQIKNFFHCISCILFLTCYLHWLVFALFFFISPKCKQTKFEGERNMSPALFLWLLGWFPCIVWALIYSVVMLCASHSVNWLILHYSLFSGEQIAFL